MKAGDRWAEGGRRGALPLPNSTGFPKLCPFAVPGPAASYRAMSRVPPAPPRLPRSLRRSYGEG